MRAIGMGYVPWPLGQEAQAAGNGADNGAAPGSEWWRAWTTPEGAGAASGGFADIIRAIRGEPPLPPGMVPGAYPGPSPWMPILIIGGLVIATIIIIPRLMKKRSNPRRRSTRRRRTAPRRHRRRLPPRGRGGRFVRRRRAA